MIRKIFDIYINDIPHPVYQIEGKTHKMGSLNGCPDSWWLYKGKEEIPPNSRELLLELSNEEFDKNLIPYIDKGVHRICWEINYKQRNSIKYKWDDYDIRSHGLCVLKANGREVYKFSYSDLHQALTKAQVLVNKLMSHPYNFLNPEEDNGRKIFFHGLPAFVQTGYEVGEIRIVPDYEEISKEKWWEIYEFVSDNNMSKFRKEKILTFQGEDDYDDSELHKEDINENKEYGSINWGDALSDGNIWWFRN